MPLLAAGGAFSFFSFFLSSSDDGCLEVVPFSVVSPLVSFSAFFFLFLLPGAFFNACVRPFSFSVFTRRFRRAISVGWVGAMGMMSFSA